MPQLYTNGADDWRKMIARTDLDAILIVTPWQLHTPMAVAAMEATGAKTVATAAVPRARASAGRWMPREVCED